MIKKKLILTLLLCACLTSCAQPSTQPNDFEDSTSTEETTNDPQAPDNSEDADTKIAYYEHLVNELQQELLNVKTELYVSRIEYESRISELEKEAEKTPPTTESGPPKQDTADFTYELNNGSLTVTSYVGNQKSVTVPASIDGYAVTAIGDRTFSNRSDVTCVVIPDSVTTIGWFAFSGCVALSEVSIPSSVNSIGYGAFQNCNASLTVKCATDSYARLYANSYGINTSR